MTENKPGDSYVVTQLQGLKLYKSWVKQAKKELGRDVHSHMGIFLWKALAGPGYRHV